ncbi:MAG: hypothetical protein IPP37_10910 [Saprospiraceae bacterium]|nr:hypothetical protein [Saprospiraceae bacterium]
MSGSEGSEVSGTCPYAGKASVGNGASVDLSLGWDSTMIYRFTNVPDYQWLVLSLGW